MLLDEQRDALKDSVLNLQPSLLQAFQTFIRDNNKDALVDALIESLPAPMNDSKQGSRAESANASEAEVDETWPGVHDAASGASDVSETEKNFLEMGDEFNSTLNAVVTQVSQLNELIPLKRLEMNKRQELLDIILSKRDDPQFVASFRDMYSHVFAQQQSQDGTEPPELDAVVASLQDYVLQNTHLIDSLEQQREQLQKELQLLELLREKAAELSLAREQAALQLQNRKTLEG
jgi:hypothetical protein